MLHEALWGGVPGEVATLARVPAWLRDFVNALVSAHPDDRPSSARAALAWLDARKGRLRRRTLGAAAAAAMIIASVAWGWPRVASSQPPLAATIEIDAGHVVVAAATPEAVPTVDAAPMPVDAGVTAFVSSTPDVGLTSAPKPGLGSKSKKPQPPPPKKTSKKD